MTSWWVVFAAAAIAGIGWGGLEWMGVTALLPAVWIASKNRWQGASTILVYYLVGSRCIPDSSNAFFDSPDSLALGIGLWLAAAIINTMPWVLAWPRTATFTQLAIRIPLVMFVLVIPPFGIVGWLNPLLGAASIFAGMGWSAFLLGAIVMVVAAAITRNKPISILLLFLPIAISQAVKQPLPPVPKDWQGMDVKWGKAPSPATKAEYQRWRLIVTTSQALFNQGAKVVVLPEQTLASWTRATETYLTAALKEDLDRGYLLVIGSSVEEAGHLLNAATILSKEGVDHYYARQTVPVSMWRPWETGSYGANWVASGLKTIAGKEVAVSICYEDFLPWISLAPFIQGKPEVIISIANGWWAGNTNEVIVQRAHITTVARIFGVPVVRALNLPDEKQ